MKRKTTITATLLILTAPLMISCAEVGNNTVVKALSHKESAWWARAAVDYSRNGEENMGVPHGGENPYTASYDDVSALPQ